MAPYPDGCNLAAPGGPYEAPSAMPTEPRRLVKFRERAIQRGSVNVMEHDTGWTFGITTRSINLTLHITGEDLDRIAALLNQASEDRER